MKHVRSYLSVGLGVFVLLWSMLELLRRSSGQFANIPALPEEQHGNPAADKIVTINAAKNVSSRITPSVMRAEPMRNAGNSTAQAALETELYALRQGDPTLVASVITFEPADTPKIVELLSTVPLEIRKQYPTPERLVAFLFMGGQRMESVKYSPKLLPATISLYNISDTNSPRTPPFTMKTWCSPMIRADGKVSCLLD